ncbi:replication-relaxation family protein [Streptomyces sp. 8N114]|uniref:replication-relaxation family protein n=1 Tax=Streptomyces sp. 8N114 TaxID=3457419 RepID=UPI003FD213E6
MLQALGIFQRATADQLWKLTRPANRHDKLTRETLLDLEDHRLVRIESVQDDQRQVWVLTARGHREAKRLLQPEGIRLSALRKQEYDPGSGEVLGTGYDDHAAAVTSTAAELHRAGIGNRLGFQTEVAHRLASGYVQRADLVMRAAAAGVPVLLLEIDRRTEDAHELVHKLRRYADWFRQLPADADERTKRLAGAGGDIAHEQRLWRRFYPPTGREGTPPLAFVFADTTPAKVANTVKVLEEAGRRHWCGTRYDPGGVWEGVTARDYSQAVPVIVTTLEELREHGAHAAVWRRLGRNGKQTLNAALDNPDGDALFHRQAEAARAKAERRRAAEREARRPVCTRCGAKFTDERWEQTTTRPRSWKAGDLTICGTCHADDAARKKAADHSREATPAPQPEPEHDQEPGRLRGLFRRRA